MLSEKLTSQRQALVCDPLHLNVTKFHFRLVNLRATQDNFHTDMESLEDGHNKQQV